MTAGLWNIIGLFSTLLGILLLFRYGMPFRVRTDGAIYLIAEQTDRAEQNLERRYTVLGYIGLLLVICGTIVQMYANYMTGI